MEAEKISDKELDLNGKSSCKDITANADIEHDQIWIFFPTLKFQNS